MTTPGIERPDREECPACGGAGGGPFGPPNSGWDIETYECPRCEGWGYIRAGVKAAESEKGTAPPRPGIAKTTPSTAPGVAAVEEKKKRKAAKG